VLDKSRRSPVDGDYTFSNEICYTGGIYDWISGQYYLNARFYDPGTGRFLSEDTYRGDVNNPNSLHLYAYCSNNPINYMDPSGHAALSNRRIYLDAGHGGSDPGAIAYPRYRYNGRFLEKDLNLKLVNVYIRPKLIALGATVLRSRATDKYISPVSRYENANERGASIFVSVHHNSSHFPWKNGTTVAYAGTHNVNSSKRLAGLINNSVSARAGFYKRDLIESTGLIVLKGTKMPAVLTETGYMSNGTDLERIVERPNDIANGIVAGIREYFN
jgi:RHS repeat-associated protein